MPPDPQQAKRWYDFLLSSAERGGPLVTVLTIVFGGLTIWYLLQTVTALSTRNRDLYERLVTNEQHFRRELERYTPCPER